MKSTDCLCRSAAASPRQLVFNLGWSRTQRGATTACLHLPCAHPDPSPDPSFPNFDTSPAYKDPSLAYLTITGSINPFADPSPPSLVSNWSPTQAADSRQLPSCCIGQHVSSRLGSDFPFASWAGWGKGLPSKQQFPPASMERWGREAVGR